MYFQSLEPTFQLFSITVIQCFRKIPSTQNPTGSVKKQVGLQNQIGSVKKTGRFWICEKTGRFTETV